MAYWEFWTPCSFYNNESPGACGQIITVIRTGDISTSYYHLRTPTALNRGKPYLCLVLASDETVHELWPHHATASLTKIAKNK